MLSSLAHKTVECTVGPVLPDAKAAGNAAPRVSVIIPSYKAAATLERAAQSVMNQTEEDLEIIIVDDASPDETWNVALQLQRSDKRVRVERLAANSGKSHVMNFATNLARGKWIALLDADDWYAPNRIEQLVGAAEARGVEMAADNLYIIDNHAGLCSGTGFPIHGSTRLIDLDVFLKTSNPTARYDYGMLQPIYRADFIREHALDYYEPARIGEDFYQLLCFFQAGGRAIVLDTPFYYYIEPFGTISRQWAQPTRSQYNYASMLETHEHFSSRLGTSLNVQQKALLDHRKSGIETMISIHQIGLCRKNGDFKGMLERIAYAPPRVWGVVCKRLASRLRTVLLPPKGSPILGGQAS